MQTSTDPVDQIKTAGTIIATISGFFGLVALIRKGWKNWKAKHPTFRRTVLTCLEQIKDGQRRFEDFNAATLRERLSSIYNVYVLDLGWCSRNHKELAAILYDLYISHFASETEKTLLRREQSIVLELPESKDQRKEYTQ